MEWLKDYWWMILIILIGMFINTIKSLNKISYKSYLDKKKGHPTRTNTTQNHIDNHDAGPHDDDGGD